MENIDEIWKDMVGYEGLYQVSNRGRVKKHYTYTVSTCYQKKGDVKIYYLRRKRCNTGYLSCSIFKDGVTKHICAHRIVATTFIPNPENKPQVNHINGKKWDNRVENLEWCTAKENIHHAIRTGLTKCYGTESALATVSGEMVGLLRSLHEIKGMGATVLSKKYNISVQTIRNIIVYKTYGNIHNPLGKKWENGVLPKIQGEHHHQSKLKETDVISIRERFKNGTKVLALAKEYSMTPTNIHSIVNRKIWKNI